MVCMYFFPVNYYLISLTLQKIIKTPVLLLNVVCLKQRRNQFAKIMLVKYHYWYEEIKVLVNKILANYVQCCQIHLELFTVVQLFYVGHSGRHRIANWIVGDTD